MINIVVTFIKPLHEHATYMWIHLRFVLPHLSFVDDPLGYQAIHFNEFIEYISNAYAIKLVN